VREFFLVAECITSKSNVYKRSDKSKQGVKNQNTHSMVLTFSFDPDFKIEKNKK